jgi:hypothetical protein
MANITYRVDTAEVDVPKTFPNPALQVTESEEAGSTKPGPTLENERAGRRGFLQGWLDENWALSSHRFWSGSSVRCIAYRLGGHRIAHASAFLTLGTASSLSRGPKFEGLRPQPIAPRLCPRPTERRAQLGNQ